MNESRATNGYGQSDWYRTVNYNTNNYFNYTKSIDKHDLDATLGTVSKIQP